MTSNQQPATSNPLSCYWLLLGVSALAIAGLFALVLVLARAPDTDTALLNDWFHKALVVHVDLSVLVWFLSIACLMWSYFFSSLLPPSLGGTKDSVCIPAELWRTSEGEQTRSSPKGAGRVVGGCQSNDERPLPLRTSRLQRLFSAALPHLSAIAPPGYAWNHSYYRATAEGEGIMIEKAALICFALGTLAIAASPLDPHGAALMSNYIPVITSPVFFFGLGLLVCGVGLMLVKVISLQSLVSSQKKSLLATDDWRLVTTLPIALMALLAFVWSYIQMPAPEDIDQYYYDTLFWGGGHVLQLLHVQVVMIVWLMLAKALKPEFSVYKPHLYALFAIGLVTSLVTPLAYLLYQADDPSQRLFFTNMMILASGVAPTILALWIIPGLISLRRVMLKSGRRALYSSLFTSLILFIYGDILGALIQGQNVVIPAHYHGAIVGITLAFMGLAYLLLPQFGWRDVMDWRLAFWQPIIYGGGQALHITGLAISGGYGVLRKTPGGLEHVSIGIKAAMGLMGLGGVLAIIGGFMFVVVVGKSVLSRHS